MSQKEPLNVLVAMLPEKQDWQILHEQGWYRIPINSAPPIIKNGTAEYIAFYHTAKFDEDLKWKVIKYAKIKRIFTASRKDLFPNESPYSKKAWKKYYKIEVEDLITLEQPFVSRRGHRILFVPTTEAKLFSGKTDFNLLFKGSPLEEDMLSIIEAMGLEYEREWQEFVDEKKFYYLDFAIFCQKGNIDIECDGNEFHMGDDNVHRDKTRNNELEGYGWAVLRYTTKHFKEERPHIEKTIYNKIKDFGGIKKVAEPEVAYYPNKGNNAQIRLFAEPKTNYGSDKK